MTRSMQFKASKVALNRYLIHQQELGFKLQAVLAVEAYDKQSPVYHMGVGNRASLDKTDIPKKVKEFYDAYYEKSKVSMITIGNKDNFDIKTLKAELEKSLMSSSMKTRPAREESILKQRAPENPRDTYIMIDDKSSNIIQYMYAINLDPDELTHLTFVKIVLKKVLDDMLIQKNKIALGVSISSDFRENFVWLAIEVASTISGRKNPSQIHGAITDLVQNLYKYLNSYDKMATYLWKKYMLTTKASDPMARLSPILNNLELFGIGRLLSGSRLLDTYSDAIMARLLTQLRDVGRCVVVVGNFDTDKDFNNDYMMVFSGEIVKNDNYGADVNAISKIRLNKRVEQYEVNYASTTLTRSESDAAIRESLKDKRLQLPKDIRENKYVPTAEQINDLKNYRPSKKYEKLETGNQNYTDILNDKYNIPMASFYMQMNFDMTVNKKAYLDVSYWISIIKHRLLPIVVELKSLRSSISVKHDTDGMIVSIDSLPGISIGLLKDLVAALKIKDVTQDEHELALDTMYKAGLSRNKPTFDASSAVSRYIFEGSPNQADKLKYAKDNAQLVKDKHNLKEIKIGLIHYEHAGPSMSFKDAQTELSNFKYGLAGFAHVKLKLPDKDKTVLIRVEKSNPEDKSIGITACNFVGDNTPKTVALSFTLSRLLSTLAFDYLRTQKKLGYIAHTSAKRIHFQIAFCLIIQGDKSLSLTQTEAEKFWDVADKYLAASTEKQVDQIVNILYDLNKMPFHSLKEESKFIFERLKEGNNLEYKKDILEELLKVKKADLVAFFDASFKKETRRIIAESLSKEQLVQPASEELKTFNLLNSAATVETVLNI